MAPAYKLTYFNGRGNAEAARFLFAYGNIEYEDIRIPNEKWPEVKPTIPFGQLPSLEHNGVIIPQSVSIARYLGKLVGLGGKNEWEDLQIDSIVDCYVDFRQKLVDLFHVQDEEEKKALMEKIKTETIPPFLSKLDDIIKANNGYLALERLTWADFFVAAQLELVNTFFDNTVKKYPALDSMFKKVTTIPQIKAWMKKRPVSEY